MSREPRVIDLTTELLVQPRDGVHEIRAELTETNARIDETNVRIDKTNARIDQTHVRLDKSRVEFLAALGATEALIGTRLDKVGTRLDELEAAHRVTNDHLGQLVGAVGVVADRTARHEARLAERTPSADDR